MKNDDIDGEIEGEPKAVAAAPIEDEYEIEILDIEWSPDHSQQYVEFKAHGAPVFSYSAVKDGPILRATVNLTIDTSMRLTAGASSSGSALVKSDAASFAQTFGSPLGSDFTRAEGVPQGATETQVVAACRDALRRHIVEALEENERASFRKDEQKSLVGKRIKVRT